MYIRDTELTHHGIKGMHLGVRRYQNSDGTLTEAGRKRISKQYQKYSAKGNADMNREHTAMYVRAHNKVASSGLDEKYNKSWEKKHGKNYNDPEYYKGFEKMTSKAISKAMNQEYDNFIRNNKNYKKATELVKKYDMTQWDELARENSKEIDYVRKRL